MGRRNHTPKSVWGPSAIAQIRAELDHAYQEIDAQWTRRITRQRRVLGDLSSVLDSQILMDIRPDMHDELDGEREEAVEDIIDLVAEQAYLRIAARVLSRVTPTWVPASAIPATRAATVEPCDATDLVGFANTGWVLFEEPVTQVDALWDSHRLVLPSEVTVDSMLWWSIAGDHDGDDDEDPSAGDDDERLLPDAVVVHILTRSDVMPSFMKGSAQAKSILKDVSTIVVPLDVDAEIPRESQDLVPAAEFLAQFGTAVSTHAVHIGRRSLPPGKQRRGGDGLDSVAVIRAA
ncbi:hypothetical protein AAFP30_20455 [Gordonia sp. CPCC 205515]|uniref:hypothetical protein n=1 Tax=Gordonia sp. CPCC 205515 TaxID=3140791 RepID=UPI003AF3D449